MDDTTRLALPLVAPGQAQKHVTVNEAFTRLDGLVQAAVAGTASAPPGNPEEGECWIVGAAATGAWQGWAGDLALFAAGGWLRLAAREGWRVWDMEAQAMRLRAAAGWVAMAGVLGFETGTVTGLGINAAADAVNRFVFDGSNMLFTSAGSIDAALNKAAPGGEASLSFKTGYSVRAMAGLLGDDDFTLKVSDDGSVFQPALVVRRGTGLVEMPAGARIAGHGALHRGNILGPVAEAGGVPAGAVIERGANANGGYVRFADGTQMCWHKMNLGSATAFGNGTWDNVYRTDVFTWAFPAAFAALPVVSGQGSIASAQGNARRMVLSSRYLTETGLDAIQAFRVGSHPEGTDCFAELFTVGRWF